MKKSTGQLMIPLTIYQPLVVEQTITLTEKGIIAILYYKAFNEVYPQRPTAVQKLKIDAVIRAIRESTRMST